MIYHILFLLIYLICACIFCLVALSGEGGMSRFVRLVDTTEVVDVYSPMSVTIRSFVFWLSYFVWLSWELLSSLEFFLFFCAHSLVWSLCL